MGFFCIFLSQLFMRFFLLGQDCSNTRNRVRDVVVVGKKREVRICGRVAFPDLGRGKRGARRVRSNDGRTKKILRRRMTVFIHVGVRFLISK